MPKPWCNLEDGYLARAVHCNKTGPFKTTHCLVGQSLLHHMP